MRLIIFFLLIAANVFANNSDTLLFDYNSFTLKSTPKAMNCDSFVVTGYTCPIGDAYHNGILATNRAKSVASFYTNARIVTVGETTKFGELSLNRTVTVEGFGCIETNISGNENDTIATDTIVFGGINPLPIDTPTMDSGMVVVDSLRDTIAVVDSTSIETFTGFTWVETSCPCNLPKNIDSLKQYRRAMNRRVRSSDRNDINFSCDQKCLYEAVDALAVAGVVKHKGKKSRASRRVVERNNVALRGPVNSLPKFVKPVTKAKTTKVGSSRLPRKSFSTRVRNFKRFLNMKFGWCLK